MKPVRRKLISIITLLFFFSSVSAFVAYKSGVFGNTFESRIQEVLFIGDGALNATDSPGKDSTKPKVILPSSKVLITTMDVATPANDSTKNSNGSNEAAPANNAAPSKPNDTYIHSTKSGPVFTPKSDTQQQKNNQKPKQ